MGNASMKKIIFESVLIFLLIASIQPLYADDGYRLWLKYDLISKLNLLKEYRNNVQVVGETGCSLFPNFFKIAHSHRFTGT